MDHNTEDDLLASPQVRAFVQGLSHEIGNNLQAIKGEVELLVLAGALPQQSLEGISRGVEGILDLTNEVNEYLSSAPCETPYENPSAVICEVIQNLAPRLNEGGVRVDVDFADALPELPLGSLFRDALQRILDFSPVLLPNGGDLEIAAEVKCIKNSLFVELRIANVSPTPLTVEESEIFRPYLKVNGSRAGLTLSIARQILHRQFGKISFHKEQRNCGVFAILLNLPSDTHFSRKCLSV